MSKRFKSKLLLAEQSRSFVFKTTEAEASAERLFIVCTLRAARGSRERGVSPHTPSCASLARGYPCSRPTVLLLKNRHTKHPHKARCHSGRSEESPVRQFEPTVGLSQIHLRSAEAPLPSSLETKLLLRWQGCSLAFNTTKRDASPSEGI
jgi:hypothetical protein